MTVKSRIALPSMIPMWTNSWANMSFPRIGLSVNHEHWFTHSFGIVSYSDGSCRVSFNLAYELSVRSF